MNYYCWKHMFNMKRFKRVLIFFIVLLYAGNAFCKVKIACVGNSITEGFGLKNPAEESYPAVLGKLLGPDYQVRNFGLSARTLMNKGNLPYMKEEIFHRALSFNPDIVTIKLGTNDTKPRNWKYSSGFEADMEAMVDSFALLPSNPEIYLIYPVPVYKTHWGINDSIIVNSIIPAINRVAEKKHVKIIDMHTPLLGYPRYFSRDYVHPSKEGAAVIARQIYKALTGVDICSNIVDSVYMCTFSTSADKYHNGLQIAWSRDKIEWHVIGNKYGFVKSDYGAWGSQKMMISPYFYKSVDGYWYGVWQLNDKDNAFSYTRTKDFINWKPQDYPKVSSKNCLRPVVGMDANGKYFVKYASEGKYYKVLTSDFVSFSDAKSIPAGEYGSSYEKIILPLGSVEGQIFHLPYSFVRNIINSFKIAKYDEFLNRQRSVNDSKIIGSGKVFETSVKVVPDESKKISDKLIGVFFEDINYAADGGLYAEMVQNRSFEYYPGDRKFHDKKWNSKYSWFAKGSVDFEVSEKDPLNKNNRHYCVLKVKGTDGYLSNNGFDGMSLSKGKKYDFSMFAKAEKLGSKNCAVQIRLVDKNGGVVASGKINIPGRESWNKYGVTLKAGKSAVNCRLEIVPLNKCVLYLDMISMFPGDTFKGRKNGLRKDLAQAIADIHPKFVRFPGGCVIHGDGIENIYKWKNTIGPVEQRKGDRNIWKYHQSMGLGFYEYFQFCEDIGAEPLPVIAAGVPCQNSSTGGFGQQGGVKMEDMDSYISDILDLIEWANGSVDTEWGKKRAEEGHPAPFNLKYIGIGNEDLISDAFAVRYKMICSAVKEKYPDIKIAGTAGPFYKGSDYDRGWRLANELNLDLIDEHYYNPPGWFINNQDFYDNYKRNGTKVYLGEYASHVHGRKSNIESALSEALYLTSVERNADVVSMTSYAPLLANKKHINWKPDLIYFDNENVYLTVNYYVQKLFGQNSGDEYIPACVSVNDNRNEVSRRVGVSVVKDNMSGDVIIKLVNLLPSVNKVNADISSIGTFKSKAVRTVLSGSLDDSGAKPVISEFNVSSNFKVELPPYSFTVIRIERKK